ncbi:MAG: diguanylate cyclase [Betaproteobacteria bacterium]
MASDQAVVVCDQEKIVLANEAAIGLLGATAPSQVVGQPPVHFFGPVIGEAALRKSRSEAAAYVVANLTRLDKEVATVSMMLIPCRYGGKLALQILVRDGQVRQRLEGRVSYLVHHDILTELPNRTEFRDRLIGAIGRASRKLTGVSVVRLNLDHFRAVNEKHGNETGDLVLREIASRIRNAIRPGDTVARLSGDDFGLILEGLERRELAVIVINRVLAALKAPINAPNSRITVGTSAGIAAYPDDALEIDPLLRVADVALFAAKADGRGGFRFYFPALEAVTHRDEARRDEIARRAAFLTGREREVMDVLVEGNTNRAIAFMLGASPRTIENHRAQVMRKMEADSLPDLVRMALELKKANGAVAP